MKEQIKNKLVALEAKVDAKLFGNWYAGMPPHRVPADITDEELDKLGGVAVNPARLGVAAATLGAGYGGLVADRQIMNRYGGGGSGMAVRGAAYRSAGRDMMETGRFMGGKMIDAGNDGIRAGQRSWRATKPGAIGNKAGSTGLFGRFRKALGKGLAVATGGKIRFEEIKQRVVELAENLDRMDSRARGAAVGGVVGMMPGALVGAGVGQVAGRNKKKKLSQRDRAMLAGSIIGVPGVLGAHVLVPNHEYK